jgi:acylphosphatase
VSDAQKSDPVRRQAVYHGRVQGVCFRAISFELAQGFQVVGHVRNLFDGTVELEAEGPEPEVDRFLAAVAEHFTGNITDAEMRALPVRADEREFHIKY